MSNPLDKHRFAKALRVPDPAAVKRVTEHFEAQKDLFATCQRCKAHLKGSLEELKAHACPEIQALI